MKVINFIKISIFMVVMFVASYAYGAAIGEVIKVTPDLTWPLIFNGLVPGGTMLFIGKRYLAKQDAFHDELIKSKNEHEARLVEIETIHQQRGCDQPASSKGRRKEDR